MPSLAVRPILTKTPMATSLPDSPAIEPPRSELLHTIVMDRFGASGGRTILSAARIVDGSLRDPNSGHGVTGLLCGFAALGHKHKTLIPPQSRI